MIIFKKKKSVLFVGTANWPQRLSKLVNKYCGQEVTARAVSLSIKTIPYFVYWSIRSGAVVRVGVRPGIKKWQMFAFDCIWQILKAFKRRAGFFYYWIGTDVLMACRSPAMDGFFLKRSKGDTHLSGAPWFVDELRSIDIDSELYIFPLDMSFDNSPSAELQAVSVLTYIPDARSEFYGGQLILKLAERYPNIKFNIVGGDGCWTKNATRNVKFFGWLPNLKHLLEDRPIVIRLVPHDAVGGTIREGLAYGCYVICTYDIPHCFHVHSDSVEELYAAFDHALMLRNNKETDFNYDGFCYAKNSWDPEILTKQLVCRIVTREQER
ncbi:glycosyltransferase family 4 protein [Stutzerimonas frequens]|uniref:glycosyltransferase family 4 protein n=1 Tax=Stutzerimonas frequens TaxID=2968969 RepID=UPI0013A64CA4|nr:glycosyltransferase family 4 protein [Stutzerimonas frequens]